MLQDILSFGRGGEVTAEERKNPPLGEAGREFLERIGGADGKRALRERAKWLADHAVTKFFRFDADEVDRQLMIEEMGEIGPQIAEIVPDVIPLLCDSLKDDDAWIRFAAAKALGKIDAFELQAFSSLIEALSDGKATVRAAAAWALGESGREAEALRALLDDPSAFVAKAAIQAIAKTGFDSASHFLADRYLLKPTLRREILEALASMGHRASFILPRLKDILKTADGAERAGLEKTIEAIEKDLMGTATSPQPPAFAP